MQTLNKTLAATLLILPLITMQHGCSLRGQTPYAPPQVDLPQLWANREAMTADQPGPWWQRFNDPRLDRLIEAVQQQNLDLATASLTLRRARLQAEMAESDRLPGTTIGGSLGLSRELGSSDSGETRNFAASGTVSYELDLWGKLANTAEAAHWEARASAEDQASLALSLVGTTAATYWQLAYLNQRITLSTASIAYARQTLALVQVQKEAGAATELEILEAKRSLASQEASHALILQQRVEARNTLALLLGGAPQRPALPEPEDLLATTLPEIAAGLPTELLARRPDLRAAESRIRAALAATDATRAGFYPAISLTGSLGDSSDDLSRLLSNPVAALAADIALPFIQWRDVQRNIDISETEYDQMVLSFKKALYTALAEVENSLAARRHYRQQEEKLLLTLQTAQKTEALYQVRYRAGGSPLKSWLDAQENRRQAEVALAENRLNQLQNYITLAKALGGDPATGTAAIPGGETPSS